MFAVFAQSNKCKTDSFDHFEFDDGDYRGFMLFAGDPFLLVLGAFAAQTGVLADSLDGPMARLKNNGSRVAACFDVLCDFLRISILCTTLSAGQHFLHNDVSIFLWMMAFMMLYLAEAWIPMTLKNVSRFYKEPQDWPIRRMDRYLLNLKDRLDSNGLRLVFFGFNEREALVFFIGPLFMQVKGVLIVTVVLAIPFLILRFLLDSAMFKNHLHEGSRRPFI